jgi:hypothetical protein
MPARMNAYLLPEHLYSSNSWTDTIANSLGSFNMSLVKGKIHKRWFRRFT